MLELRILYWKMNKLEEARNTLAHAIAINEKLYGEFHNQTAVGYEYLGIVYKSQSKKSEAIFCLRRH